jgi:hypothetical protein
MIRSPRFCVYAVFSCLLFCSQSTAFGKEGKEGKSLNSESNSVAPDRSSQFEWNDHNKLSWEDFRGEINANTEESAAATHCGIGFRTKTVSTGKNPEIIVYNTFYTNKSWVKSDAKLPSILNHEQGHFDLCEIYTRKLRARMSKFDFKVNDVKQNLMSIYTDISNEYESRQHAYERETIHGTNLEQQNKWCKLIARELL